MASRYLRKLLGRSRPKPTTTTTDAFEAEVAFNSADENVAGCSSSGSSNTHNTAQCSLPLLQVWPSQDSPKPGSGTTSNNQPPHFIFNCDDQTLAVQQNDSGIESVQASPSPCPSQCFQPRDDLSPTPSGRSRRASSIFLHPNHARFIRRQSSSEQPPSEENMSASSSVASSMASISVGQQLNSCLSDPWDRRRSSALTARYSLMDTTDLEYALLRAAARNSVGYRSFSHSFHKLTFTQTLAFPALARGLANRNAATNYNNRGSRNINNDGPNSGMNTLAKVITAIVLVFTSLLVFVLVFNYVTV